MNPVLWIEIGVISGSAFFWGVVLGFIIGFRTQQIEWRSRKKGMPEKA